MFPALHRYQSFHHIVLDERFQKMEWDRRIPTLECTMGKSDLTTVLSDHTVVYIPIVAIGIWQHLSEYFTFDYLVLVFFKKAAK